MDTNTTNNTIYFKNLDALRFFAVFMVFFAHAYEGWCGWFNKPGFLTVNNNYKEFSFVGEIINRGILNGGFGVDVFFLISGFLITFLLLKEKEKTQKIHIPNFFIRRSLRIWPAYFLLIALTPWFIHLANGKTPDYLPNLLFYNNFHAIKINEWQYPFAHLWSICVEEHFYLLWPFVIAFWPKKHLPKLFGGILLSSILFRMYVFYAGWNPLYNYLHTLARVDVIVLGASFAYYFFHHSITFKSPKWLRISIYLLFLIVFFSTPVYSYDSMMEVTLKKYFFSLIIGYGMIHFLFNPNPLFRLPFIKTFNYLGKISYGMYLFSNVLIPIIVIRFMYKWSSQNMYLYFFLNFILTVGIASFVYHFIEKPILKWKKRFEIVQTKR